LLRPDPLVLLCYCYEARQAPALSLNLMGFRAQKGMLSIPPYRTTRSKATLCNGDPRREDGIWTSPVQTC